MSQIFIYLFFFGGGRGHRLHFKLKLPFYDPPPPNKVYRSNIFYSYIVTKLQCEIKLKITRKLWDISIWHLYANKWGGEMVGEFSPSESEYKDLQHRVGVSY